MIISVKYFFWKWIPRSQPNDTPSVFLLLFIAATKCPWTPTAAVKKKKEKWNIKLLNVVLECLPVNVHVVFRIAENNKPFFVWGFYTKWLKTRFLH